MKIRYLLSLLFAFALVAAACGGGDSDSAAETDGGSDTEATEGEADEAGASGAGLDIDAILAADLANCAAAPTGDPIQVGMAMDFSEVVGFVDIPGSMLNPFVAEKINCSGGINGSPVEVRVAEVGDDAALAAQELLDWGCALPHRPTLCRLCSSNLAGHRRSGASIRRCVNRANAC